MAFSIFEWKKSELLFVLAIVGVVLGVSLTQLSISEMKTRDAQRKADVELVARALKRYYEDFKQYPAATQSGEIVSCGRKGEEVCKWGGGPIVDEYNVVYLNKLPVDPQAYEGRIYLYQPDDTRQNFRIYVGLEYGRDKDLRKGLTQMCGPDVQCSWYAAN